MTHRLKRLAEEHPDQNPSQILRTELANASEGALSNNKTYVNGIRAQGRRRTVAPRYPPTLCNVYEKKSSKTCREELKKLQLSMRIIRIKMKNWNIYN